MRDMGHKGGCKASTTRGYDLDTCTVCGGSGKTKEGFVCSSCHGLGRKPYLLVTTLDRNVCRSDWACGKCQNHEMAKELVKDDLIPEGKKDAFMKKSPPCRTDHCKIEDCVAKRFRPKESFVLKNLPNA